MIPSAGRCPVALELKLTLHRHAQPESRRSADSLMSPWAASAIDLIARWLDLSAIEARQPSDPLVLVEVEHIKSRPRPTAQEPGHRRRFAHCASSLVRNRRGRRSRLYTGVAEREGFEPSIRLPVYTLSKRAPSATRPPLQCRCLGRVCGIFQAKTTAFATLDGIIPRLAAGGGNPAARPALSRWKIPLKENGLWARACCYG